MKIFKKDEVSIIFKKDEVSIAFWTIFLIKSRANPQQMHTTKFFPNFREKFEKFFWKFCKNRKSFIKIMKNWPKIVIFHCFFNKNFWKFLRRSGGSVHRNPPGSDPPTSLWPCPKKSPQIPGPCHRMLQNLRKLEK